MADGMSSVPITKEEEASPPPGYTEPGYPTPGYPAPGPMAYPAPGPMNTGYWQHGYPAYSSVPVPPGVIVDDALLIPGVSDQVLFVRERESFVKQIILSCVVFWLCCWPLGLTAFILAMIANNKSKLPDDMSAAEAHKLGVHSTRASIAGMIIGIIFIITFVIITVTTKAQSNY